MYIFVRTFRYSKCFGPTLNVIDQVFTYFMVSQLLHARVTGREATVPTLEGTLFVRGKQDRIRRYF